MISLADFKIEIIWFILITSHIQGVYHKKRGEYMSEKEKRIIEKLKEAIPNMSDFDKGYILGKTESFSENKSDDSGKTQKESS